MLQYEKPTAPQEGYYWARHFDGTTFVVYLEKGSWYTVGVQNAINETFSVTQIIKPIMEPHH